MKYLVSVSVSGWEQYLVEAENEAEAEEKAIKGEYIGDVVKSDISQCGVEIVEEVE